MAGDDLLVGVGVDLGPLSRDITKATKFFGDFKRDVEKIITNTQFGGDFSVKGRRAAANLIGGLRAEFNSSSANLREALARGLISDDQFRVIGIGAAEEFNKALAAGMDRLDAQGLLPQGLRQELQNEFKDIGEGSGKAIADAIGDKLGKIGQRLTSTGKALSVGLTAPLVALATGAIAASETIDDALDTIRIGTGKTGAALAGLERDFDTIFARLPVSATDAATAITLLNQRTGATGANLQSLATDILNLSRITKTDLAENIERTQRAFATFGIAAKDQGAALNFLFKTSQATGAKLDDLAGSMAKFGPSLRSLGFNFQQSAALLGQFEKQGVDVDRVLSRLQSGVAKFAAKGVAAPDLFRSLIDQIKRADSETKAINIAKNVFGTAGAVGFATAVREGKVSFDALLNTISRSPETIAAAAAGTDGFAEALQQLKNEATRALVPLGIELTKSLRAALPALVSTARAVGSLAKSFAELSPGAQKFILGTAALSAGVGPLLIGVGGMVSGFARLVPLLLRTGTAATLAAGTGTTTGLAALGARLAVGGPIIAGLGALAAAMIWASRKTEETTTDLLALRFALDQVSDNKLLSKSLTELSEKYDVVAARIKAIKDAGKTNVTLLRGTGPGGVSKETVRNPALVEQERQLTLISELITEINGKWDANRRAPEEAAAAAKKAAEDMRREMAKLSGIDIDFSTGNGQKALNDLENNVRELLGAYEELRKKGQQLPGITEALVIAHDNVTKAVKAQSNQFSTESLQLQELLRKLREIDAVLVETSRRQFGGIENIPDVPRLQTTARIVKFEKTDTDIIPVLELRGDLVDIRVPDTVAQKLLKFRDLPPITVDVDPSFDPSKLSIGLKRAFADLNLSKANIGIDKFLGDQKGLKQATNESADATKRLKGEIKAVRDLIQNSADLTPAQKAFGLKTLADQLQGADVDANNLADGIRGVTAAVHQIGSASASVGLLNSRFVEALDSVGRLANGISDLTELAASLKKAGKGGLFSSFSNVLKSLPIIGEIAASIIEAWQAVGDAVFHFKEKAANAAITKQNTEAIVRLQQDLQGFSSAIIGQQLTAADAIRDSSILQQRALTTGFSRGFKNVEALDQELRAAGTSLADLKRRAEDLGITIVDSKGRITAEGLVALEKATRIAIQALLHFKDNLEDQQFISSARRDILDLTDTQSALDDWSKLVEKFAPEIFTKFFKGIDTSTAAGKAAFEKGIRDVFNLAVTGKIPDEFLKAFGGIKGFIDFLLEADHALDAVAETSKALAGEMVNVVSGFKDFNIDRARFEATNARVATVLTTPPPPPVPTTTDVKAFAEIIAGKLPTLATGDVDRITTAIQDASAAAEITRLSDSIVKLASSMPGPVVNLGAELARFSSLVASQVPSLAASDLGEIAKAITDASPKSEIARLSDAIVDLATAITAIPAAPAPVVIPVPAPVQPVVAVPPVGRLGAPAPTTQPIIVLEWHGDAQFTQPIQNPEEFTDAVKSVFVRRARASQNPEVKRVVNLLP